MYWPVRMCQPVSPSRTSPRHPSPTPNSQTISARKKKSESEGISSLPHRVFNADESGDPNALDGAAAAANSDLRRLPQDEFAVRRTEELPPLQRQLKAILDA